MPDNLAQLYRHFDGDGALLYVGVSLSAVYRLSQHKSCSSWFNEIASVKIEAFPNREAALLAEQDAIKTENPKYNARRTGSYFVAPRCCSPEADRQALSTSIVVNPLYRIREAAGVLDMKESVLEGLIARGEIGFIERDYLWHGKPFSRKYITGWQLLEYLEAKMAETKRRGH